MNTPLAGRLRPNHVLAFTGRDRVARGVERGGSQAAAQVGDAHAREHLAANAIGRIGAGAAQNGRALAGGRQQFPDRRTPRRRLTALGGRKAFFCS